MTVNTRPERLQFRWEEETSYDNLLADIMLRTEFTNEYYKSRDEYRKELEHCILCKKRIDRIEVAINFCKENLSLEQIEQMKKRGIQFGILCCDCNNKTTPEYFDVDLAEWTS